jgi:hypothetical protein
MGFDTVKFLEDHNIEGKPTRRGWINILCPFSDCHDSSGHMGIQANTGFYHCWICGRKGPPEIIVLKLLNVRLSKAEEIVKEYSDDLIYEQKKKTIVNASSVNIKGFGTLQKMHREYLEGRRFDPEYLSRTYKIGGFGTVGRFPFRIGIPVFQNGKLVNMTARDFTGQQKERYMSLEDEEAIVSRNYCVYGYDDLQENGNVLIVEGAFDKWRIGGSTCSGLGTEFTYSKILLLLTKHPKNIFTLFDNETKAQQIAERVCYSFAPFVKHAENLKIDAEDPAELSADDGLSIRNELGL